MGNSQSNQPSSLDIFQNKQYMRFIESTTKKEPKSNDQNNNNCTLLRLSYQSINFKLIPKTFTLYTKNGSSQFNIDLLRSASSYIDDFCQRNPEKLRDEFNIDDENNVLGKFSELFNLEKVAFKQNELGVLNSISSFLLLAKCPDFMRFPKINSDKNISERYVEIDTNSLSAIIKQSKYQNFIISTKNKDYVCNTFGILSSVVLRDLLLSNPQLDHYEYDFKDEFDEFQQICDLFNFKVVKITIDNIDTLKKIVEDFQIEDVYRTIDQNLDDFERLNEEIDKQQTVVDSIEDLFNWLYNIQSLTIQKVVLSIEESDWIKTEDDVKELAAVVLQVIGSDIYLHSYLADLLVELDKKSKSSNKLNILIPFIIQKLNDNFGSDLSNCSFIYNLYKRGFIPEKKLSELLRKGSMNENVVSWFWPEIRKQNFGMNESSRIYFHYRDKVEEYKKMRDNGIPDEKLTQSIRNDDVDTLQSIVSVSGNKIDQITIRYNIFDGFDQNGSMNIVNYSASCGSLKCFKYLILNHANVSLNTFKYAFYGGNIEIIKITDQQLSLKNIKIDQNDTLEKCEIILPSIFRHKNNLFDWILENKINEKKQSENFIYNLIAISAHEGNAHSLIELISKGMNYTNVLNEIISIASNEGFYRLAKMIINLNENISKIVMNSSRRLERGFKYNYTYSYRIKNNSLRTLSPFASFGNLSIFKLQFELKNYQKILENDLCYAIGKNYVSIVKYIFEGLDKNEFVINNSCAFNVLNSSINGNSNGLFNYLLDQFKEQKLEILNDSNNLINLIKNACQSKNIEITKKLTNIVLENANEDVDFTDPFLSATFSKSIEICQFFIDKKVSIDYLNISTKNELCMTNNEIFILIINNACEEAREKIFASFLYPSIQNSNIDLVKYLLDHGAPYDLALFKAVMCGNIDIVNIILDHNSKPSFINKKSSNGTALTLAVENNTIEIVKRLLSLPGIDPSICNAIGKRPLFLAVEKKNFEIVKEIVNFYGENIQSQAYQVNEALAKAIKIISGKQFYNKAAMISILELLLSFRCIDPNINTSKNTFLTFMIKNGKNEIVQMLLKKENIDLNSFIPKNGNTPLIVAIKEKNVLIAKLLIEDKRTNINLKNNKNKSPLIIAIESKLDEIVDTLIKNDSFDPDESDINYAFYISSYETAKKLITVKNVDVNYKRLNANFKLHNTSIRSFKNYKSVLSNAVVNKDSKKVDLIIQHPSFDKEKSQLVKALSISIKKCNLVIFNKLVKLMDDINIKIDGKTSLLSFAVSHKSHKIITEILNSPTFDSEKSCLLDVFCSVLFRWKNISFELVNKLYDFDQKHDKLIDFNKLLPNGKSFFTSIQYLANCQEIVEFLLGKKADTNIPDKDQVYPLEYAIRLNSNVFIRALLDSGTIDFTKRIPNKDKKSMEEKSFSCNDYFYSDAEYKTYLHLFARKNDSSLLNNVLERHLIDINVTDDLGETPFFEACRYNKQSNIDIFFMHDDVDYNHKNNEGKDVLNIEFNRDLKSYVTVIINGRNKAKEDAKNKELEKEKEKQKEKEKEKEKEKLDIPSSSWFNNKDSFNRQDKKSDVAWGVDSVDQQNKLIDSLFETDSNKISSLFKADPFLVSNWGPKDSYTLNSQPSNNNNNKTADSWTSSWDSMFNSKPWNSKEDSSLIQNDKKDSPSDPTAQFVKSWTSQVVNSNDLAPVQNDFIIENKSTKVDHDDEKKKKKIRKRKMHHHVDFDDLVDFDSDEYFDFDEQSYLYAQPYNYNYYGNSNQVQINQLTQMRYVNEVRFNEQIQQVLEISTSPVRHQRKRKNHVKK